MVEAPHLGRLMEKVQSPGRPAPQRLNYPEIDIEVPPAPVSTSPFNPSTN